MKVAVEEDGMKLDADYAEKQERKTLHLLTKGTQHNASF